MTSCKGYVTSSAQSSLSRLITHLNRKRWWHVPPIDQNAYSLRGSFFASSFHEAEFYGRPLDVPVKVNVINPLVGDEESILTQLFGAATSLEGLKTKHGLKLIRARQALDARMKRRATELGFDSIVLMTATAFAEFSSTGRIPRSLELNLL